MVIARLCLIALVAALLAVSAPLGAHDGSDVTERARRFVRQHDSKVRPLEVAAALAWWDANVSGKPEVFARKVEAQNRLDAGLSDPKAFAELKELREHRKKIGDPVLARAVAVLYLQYLEKQVDTELLRKMVARANAVEETFNNFRAKVGDELLTDNDVRKVLKTSRDSDRLRAVWQASKAVGAAVAPQLRELVRLRNEAARQLGFKNFHALQLYLNEQDGDELVRLFDELDELTRRPFLDAKTDIDRRLAARYRVQETDLRPWHYHDPFFQETPSVLDADLDAPYRSADVLALCRDFYASIGLPIDRVIPHSDLYEKPGKSQHAFCTDINREGDVRVLGNIKPNDQWASTMLHEFGHSVYTSLNIPESLPYVLRMEAHILTTEGVAMMFERLSKRGAFLEKMGVKVPDRAVFDAAGARALRYRLLIFSRWCQVMLRFEKAMYEDPDRDLNKLWWDLVEKYQALRRPEGRDEPDYASKVHVATVPVYYHNYMMGELFASQVHHAICHDVCGGADPDTVIYAGNKEVGAFMRKRVFEPGRTLSWNELTRHATGRPLEAKAFAADFQSKR
jgi:peptidyl-dipeptidase A